MFSRKPFVWLRPTVIDAITEPVYDRAVEDFGEALRLNPANPAAYVYRGNTWEEKKDHVRAIKDYDEAIRLDPSNPASHIKRGNVRRTLGDLDQAIDDYDSVLRLKPGNDDALLNRGLTWMAKQQPDRAMKDYEEAVRINPWNTLALTTLARVLELSPDQKERDGKRAVELATRSCELTAWKNASSLKILAAACADTGRFEDAAKWQKQALEDKEYEKQCGDEGRSFLARYGLQLPRVPD
jgi:tetratricopeptide (TPR) repeat protein